MNPELKKAIRNLRSASKESGKAIWKKLADELDRPKRRRISLNLSKINRHTEAGDVVAVPGKVLSSGSLSHPVTVAAYSFSEAAKEKISSAEGRVMTLIALVGEVEPSKIKILK
jgi:large subunit ribosomal protein L18e